MISDAEAGLCTKVTIVVSGNVSQTGAVVRGRVPATVTGIARQEDITTSVSQTVGTDTSTLSVTLV